MSLTVTLFGITDCSVARADSFRWAVQGVPTKTYAFGQTEELILSESFFMMNSLIAHFNDAFTIFISSIRMGLETLDIGLENFNF